MKDQILELRSQGKSYREIEAILGCSKSTISYHCGKGQKEKKADNQRKRRADSVISKRVEGFQYDRRLRDKSGDFQRGRLHGKHLAGKRLMTFSWQDVIDKFGWNTTCYLTGRAINLREPHTYHFDHKVPVSRGGSSGIDNLGIAYRDANIAKSDMMIEDFICLCKEVLEFNGYQVEQTVQ